MFYGGQSKEYESLAYQHFTAIREECREEGKKTSIREYNSSM